MAIEKLEPTTFLLGKDDDLTLEVDETRGNSLSAATATVTIVDSAGTSVLAETAMTGTLDTQDVSKKTFTYLLQSGAAQTITAVGVYYATYLVSYGSKRLYYQQEIVVESLLPVSATTPITVDGIKSHLVGLEGWLCAAAKTGTRYDDSRIERLIPQRIRRWERETQMRINPVQVCTRRDGTYAVAGEINDVTDTYEVVDDSPHDYYPEDAVDFFKLTLHERPVRTVQRVRIVINNITYITFPTSWYQWEAKTGRFWIMPFSGEAATYAGYVQFATLQAGFGNRAYLPKVVHVDYQAGLPDSWWLRSEYADIQRGLEEYCAWHVLNDISELYDAGVMSSAISGEMFNQQLSYERFVRRKNELQQSIIAFQAEIRAQETPFSIIAL